jgi:hypothetical protein
MKHVIERSKGIINVSKRRSSIMIFGLPTASARRRNGFGVVARQQ